ncbi:hypothetical protein D3C80_1754930 [compost metagenome]
MASAPKIPHIREAEGWAVDFVFLTDRLRYSHLDANALQLYLDDRIPSGLTLDNCPKALEVLAAVLTGVSKFSLRGDRVYSRGVSMEFGRAFSGLIVEVINNSWHLHSYRTSK